jgi:N-acyl-D-aspartate/D-glutamate deacylase
MAIDLVIRNGTILDGSGAAPFVGDLAVEDGSIAEIGALELEGVPEIDASGLYVAPGFIDIHSHSDFTLLVDPRAVSAIFQGVTLEVIGNCGFGCFPIGDPALAANNIYGFTSDVPLNWSDTAGYLQCLEAAGPAVNVLTLVPNGQLRLATLGMAERPATSEELARMTSHLEASLEAGAWGLSSGLEYPAESGVPEDELTALCQTVARAGGLYATHTRYRDAGAAEAVEEAIRTAEAAEVRLQVSHLLPRSGPEECARCLEAVEGARSRGLDVAFDMHTRLFGLTYLAVTLPPWAREGGAPTLAGRLRDPEARRRMKDYQSILSAGGDWGRVVLLDNARWPEYARCDIAEIAAQRGQEPLDAVYDLLAGVVEELHALMVIIRCYTPEQQREVFAHPLCMPGSDATALAPDGPLAGSAFHGAYTWASWFYRFMVRETGALRPEEAIYKLSGLPASILKLTRRGRLARGLCADVAIFDPLTFGERGTTFAPNQPAEGMVHVLVGGVPTLHDGALTGRRAGRVLRKGVEPAAA